MAPTESSVLDSNSDTSRDDSDDDDQSRRALLRPHREPLDAHPQSPEIMPPPDCCAITIALIASLLIAALFLRGANPQSLVRRGTVAAGWESVTHRVSAAAWNAIDQYDVLLDGRIDACFAEIPPVLTEIGTACSAMEPSPAGGGLPDRTKRTVLVQYAWAPATRPLSPRCQAYAAELRMEKKTLANLFGLYRLHEIERPSAAANEWQLDDLPNVKLLEGARLPSRRKRKRKRKRKRTAKRSVILTLYDALSRALYERLISPRLRSELLKVSLSNQYTAFDFARFHVVGYNSKRNYAAVYTGHVPDIFRGVQEGQVHPPSRDKNTCDVEADALELLKAEAAAGAGAAAFDTTMVARQTRERKRIEAMLRYRCSHTLWGKYRDEGYITADMPEGYDKAMNVGAYFGRCEGWCQEVPGAVGGGALVSVARPYGDTTSSTNVTLLAVAGAFHSLATNDNPLFATMYTLATHNAHQLVHSIGYEIPNFVRLISESATTRGVPLPLIVLHADHGSHYGENTRTAAGRAEHKFPLLVILVPNALLESNPTMRHNLEVNRRRLISAFDLHHTLLQFATSNEEEPAANDVLLSDEERDEASKGILTKRNIFREIVPADRPCADAGIPPHLCQCDSWTPCGASDALAVQHQASLALATLNQRLKVMQTLGVGVECASELVFTSAQAARTSTAPHRIEFVLTVSAAGRREARFLVSMVCPDGALSVHQSCTLASAERMSSMTSAESNVYRSRGKSTPGAAAALNDGKLCLIS